MSGASKATSALRLGCLGAGEAVRRAVDTYAAAVAALLDASGPEGDLAFAMQAAPTLILAAEALAAAAGAVEADARRSLAAVLHEQGYTLRTEHHTITAKDGSRTVQITDPQAVPERFWRQPAPAPDKAEIGKALRAGEPVPGASLSNGGPPVLAITARKDKAA